VRLSVPPIVFSAKCDSCYTSNYTWSDNETTLDYLNVQAVADSTTEMIIQAKGQPLSIGVSVVE